MDLKLMVGILALAVILIFVLARFTPLFRTAPGQEINWGKMLKDSFQYILAALITVGFFTVVWILLTRAVPVDNKTELDIVLGALVGAFTGGIVNYFFGSSKGSSDKNETIAAAMKDP